MVIRAFSNDSHPSNPYRGFGFRLRIDGRTVAGFSKISLLDGDPADPDPAEGHLRGSAVTLEGGLAVSRDLERWASSGGIDATPTNEWLTDVFVDVIGPDGDVVTAYRLLRARVASYRTLPGLDSDIVDAIAIDCVTLEHEGWEREPRDAGTTAT